MASPTTITRRQAQQQAIDLQPKPPPAAEREAKGAPGSHPNNPVESDMEALAQYQGAERLPGGPDELGCWKLDAWNRPVFVPGEPASAVGGGAPRRSMTEPNEEPMEPPGEKKAGERERPESPRQQGQGREK